MPGNIIDLNPADLAKWPKPNYVDPFQRRWMPEYASILCGIATLLVLLRLWLRAMKYAGGLGLDDALLGCGWLCLCWFTVLGIVDAEVHYTSRHIWDVPFKHIRSIAEIAWLAELATLLTGGFVKVSVLLFYRRLVDRICSKPWLWAIWTAIAFTVAYTLAFILALILNCNPTEAYWEAFDPAWASTHNYNCVDTQVINILAGVMACISDLYAVALPCIMMRGMPLPPRQKIALNAIFCIGFLVVATSCVRTYYLWKVAHSIDVSTAIWNVFVWTQLELSVGIICACATMLRVLFREFFSSSISRMKRSLNSTSRSQTDPDPEQKVHITRVTSPIDLARHLSHGRRTPVLEMTDHEMSAPRKLEWDATESSLVKTPADFENLNLQTVEKSAQLYRQSSHSRGLSESTAAYSARLKSYGQRSRFYGQTEGETDESEPEHELVMLPAKTWLKT